MKYWKPVLFTFFVLTIFGLFLPLIVTQYSWISIGRSDANEIGDAIGGILSPFFSFLGSCLLSLTIWLQIKNREEDRRKDYEEVIFNESLKDVKSILFQIFNQKALIIKRNLK